MVGLPAVHGMNFGHGGCQDVRRQAIGGVGVGQVDYQF